MVLHDKMTTDDGITSFHDTDGLLHSGKMPDFAEGTPLIEKDGMFFYDRDTGLADPLADKRARDAEDFYLATRAFLPWKEYVFTVFNHPGQCMEKYRENPWFYISADNIALFPESDRRQVLHRFRLRLLEMKYAMWYVCEWNHHMGNTCMKLETFIKKVCRLLENTGHRLDREDDVYAYLNYYSNLFSIDGDMVGTRDMHEAECFIRDRAKRMLSEHSFYGFSHVHDDGLSDEQNAAVQACVAGPDIAVLTGGPGTGKTTTLYSMVKEFQENFPEKRVVLLAPTGRAVRRIKEVFKDLEVSAYTINFFLGDGHQRNRRDMERIRACDFIIVDESSMVGSLLFYRLLSQTDGTKILLVGDIDQLPSVEPGNVLGDLMALGVPVTKLTKNFRSLGTVDENIAKIRDGIPLLSEDDSFRIEHVPEELLETYAANLNPDILLTPFRKDGKTGSSRRVNRLVHEKRHPGQNGFCPGEPVMMEKTDYGAGVYNGDTGVVVRKGAGGSLYVDFSGTTKELTDTSNLSLGYAATIHKAQGSEYPFVAVCITKESGGFFNRRMFYTAVSRASERVLLFGDVARIPEIIANTDGTEKLTWLSVLQKREPSNGSLFFTSLPEFS